jgi:coproporphyrinogen III oxidase-like Fe-S oxidoreductase
MNLDEKLHLIKKLYYKNTDFNYFYNPFYRKKNININVLKDSWNRLYMKDKNHLTHFYIHTPFCIEKCSFCQYHN